MTRAAKGQSPWSPLVRIRHLSIHPRCAACHAGSRDCPRLGLPTLGHLQCEKDSNALFLYLFSFPSMPLSPHPRSILPGNPPPQWRLAHKLQRAHDRAGVPLTHRPMVWSVGTCRICAGTFPLFLPPLSHLCVMIPESLPHLACCFTQGPLNQRRAAAAAAGHKGQDHAAASLPSHACACPEEGNKGQGRA